MFPRVVYIKTADHCRSAFLAGAQITGLAGHVLLYMPAFRADALRIAALAPAQPPTPAPALAMSFSKHIVSLPFMD